MFQISYDGRIWLDLTSDRETRLDIIQTEAARRGAVLVRVNPESQMDKVEGYSAMSAVAKWIDTAENISKSRWEQMMRGAAPTYDDMIERIQAAIEKCFTVIKEPPKHVMTTRCGMSLSELYATCGVWEFTIDRVCWVNLGEFAYLCSSLVLARAHAVSHGYVAIRHRKIINGVDEIECHYVGGQVDADVPVVIEPGEGKNAGK
jgi:hypothetical protein